MLVVYASSSVPTRSSICHSRLRRLTARKRRVTTEMSCPSLGNLFLERLRTGVTVI
jgi:hypothetical protein